MEGLFELNIQNFIAFVIPGFISIKVWSLLVASENEKLKDIILEVIVYGSFNFAFFSWLIILNNNLENTLLLIVTILVVLVVGPIIWPILFFCLRKSNLFSKHFINPIPKSWDYFFSKKEACFILD